MDDRLYRSRTDRMIAGVAGGLAERYDLDPSLVRIAWALVILGTGGLFFLLYIVMIIVVPEEPADSTPPLAPTGSEASMTGATPATGPAPAGGGPDPEPSPTDAAAAGGGGTTAGAATGPQLTTGPAPAMSARDARRAARRERRDNNGPLIFGGILVIVGILAFAGQVIPGLDWDLIWPIGLIVLGAALVIGATRRRPSA